MAPSQERASVVSRIAPSFLRFGSFEVFKASDPLTGRAGPSAGREGEMLPLMVDYVIRCGGDGGQGLRRGWGALCSSPTGPMNAALFGA
jgi:hypothetical protein